MRDRVGRDRAAVDRAVLGVVRRPRHILHRLADHGLHRMAVADIAAMIEVQMPACAEEAGMLARAIVVQRRRRTRRRGQARWSRHGCSANASRIPAPSRPARPAPASTPQARHARARRGATRRRAPVPCRRSQARPPRRSRPAAAPGSPSPPSAEKPAARRRRSRAASCRRRRKRQPRRDARFRRARRAISRREPDWSPCCSLYWSNASNSTLRNPWSGSPFATLAKIMSSISSRSPSATSFKPVGPVGVRRFGKQIDHFDFDPARLVADLADFAARRHVRKGLIGNAVAEGRLLVRRRLWRSRRCAPWSRRSTLTSDGVSSASVAVSSLPSLALQKASRRLVDRLAAVALPANAAADTAIMKAKSH